MLLLIHKKKLYLGSSDKGILSQVRRLVIIPYSLFPIPYSLFPIPYSLFPVPYSLLPT